MSETIYKQIVTYAAPSTSLKKNLDASLILAVCRKSIGKSVETIVYKCLDDVTPYYAYASLGDIIRRLAFEGAVVLGPSATERERIARKTQRDARLLASRADIAERVRQIEERRAARLRLREEREAAAREKRERREARSRETPKPRKQQRCTICNEAGHNQVRCPQRVVADVIVPPAPVSETRETREPRAIEKEVVPYEGVRGGPLLAGYVR